MNTVKNILVGAAVAHVALGQYCEHQWEGKFADREVDGVPYLRARQDTPPPPLDIQPLIVNGPSSNRIDLIFFGDGCESPIQSLDGLVADIIPATCRYRG